MPITRSIRASCIVAGLSLSLLLASCEGLNQHVETATSVLQHFCLFKKSAIGQILITVTQLNALRIICAAVNEPPGVPD
jgi:hypothetical protein